MLPAPAHSDLPLMYFLVTTSSGLLFKVPYQQPSIFTAVSMLFLRRPHYPQKFFAQVQVGLLPANFKDLEHEQKNKAAGQLNNSDV